MQIYFSVLTKLYLEQANSVWKTISRIMHVLKQIAKGGLFDNSTLELYDEQIIPIAKQIFEKRKSILEELLPIFVPIIQGNISGNNNEENKYRIQIAIIGR